MENEQPLRDRSVALFPGEMRYAKLFPATSDFPVAAIGVSAFP